MEGLERKVASMNNRRKILVGIGVEVERAGKRNKTLANDSPPASLPLARPGRASFSLGAVNAWMVW